MGKTFGIPTWRKLQEIDDRLHNIARHTVSGQGDSFSAGQMTLRDLLDEAGFYDRVGGVDRVMQQAEAAADANTAAPPTLLNPHFNYDLAAADSAGAEYPMEMGYRDFFPQLNYATPNIPTEVFFTNDKGIHRNNAYFSNRIYPNNAAALSGGVAYTALTRNEKPRSVASGVYLVSPESGNITANTDFRQIAADKRRNNPLVQLLEGEVGSGHMDHLVDLGSDALGYFGKGVPPHVVLGTTRLGANFGDDYASTLFHEMTHAGLQSEPTALRSEGLLSPDVVNDILMEQPAYDDGMRPTEDPFVVFPNKIFGADKDKILTDFYNMRYRTTPIETDAVLADIKRAYADQTGRLVNSPEEAQRALEWFRDTGLGPFFSQGFPDAESALFREVSLPYQVAAKRLDADYFLNPEKYSPGESLGSDVYKRRMMEVLGLGGVGVLAGLMGEGEDDDGRVRY